MGLLDPKKLTYDEQRLGQKEEKLPPSWGQVGPKLESDKSLQVAPVKGYSQSKSVLLKSVSGAV
jgi:hypothetical protein